MQATYRDFVIRDWQASDRLTASKLICSVLIEYGLGSEPDGADWDVHNVEQAYWETGGAFWVVERNGQIVGTAAFYPIARGENAAEIRKMYLLPEVRGQGLGRFLLTQLEDTIAQNGFSQIWIETSSLLKEAVILYERSGYQLGTDVETQRCDRVYFKNLPHALLNDTGGME